MLGIKELKENIKTTDTTVECPVKGCNQKVARQRYRFRKEDKFKCPNHNIYISPSTFEYSSKQDNLLWKDEGDKDLLNRIKEAKREDRIARDNSEDATTWNVFRFLEKNKLISDFLYDTIKVTEQSPEVIYWSYSPFQDKTWDMLKKGREEFELVPSKGSEPDIIIVGRDTLLFIEAKVTASNKTKPSNPIVEDKYTTGGQNWWNEVFSSDFKTVAIANQKYELSRFWIIGTWVAKQLNCVFYLVNLVLSDREKNIEPIFKKHINEDQRNKFIRITWEDIYKCIASTNLQNNDKELIVNYFRNKTIGYDSNGKLQKAFSIP